LDSFENEEEEKVEKSRRNGIVNFLEQAQKMLGFRFDLDKFKKFIVESHINYEA
jgi:hypothetical protein